MRSRMRKLTLLALDVLLLSVAYVSAFCLRLGWSGVTENSITIGKSLPIVLLVSVVVHYRMGLFHSLLRYASFETAAKVFKAVTLSVLISCTVLFLTQRMEGIPRAVLIIHGMAAFPLIGGSRLAFRRRRRNLKLQAKATRVLLYGVEDTTEWVLRGLDSQSVRYVPLGILDDNPVHYRSSIRDVRIHGGLDMLERLARDMEIAELWICIPGLSGEPLRRIYDACTGLGLKVKALPRLENALLGADLGQFYEPDISDLLRRAPRSLDRQRVHEWIRGRKVLITGAGGSIGSELARQVAALDPHQLVLCDAGECNLFHIHQELIASHGDRVARPFLVDVRDLAGVRRMFEEVRPEVVFHAAAYKHVPMVELNVCEGALTNVSGVHNVGLAATEYGTHDFVFISTDKAVRPVNVMGATKRLGETIIQQLDNVSDTRFSAVRFGNVLGSSGSVVPIFREQIRDGGPVTVTHPEMTRFFMLVSESVELVLQAGTIARGGEVFVLDMGEPVKIADMAKDLIRLMGKSESEIEIRYTGVRPGEKIHEELLIDANDQRTEYEEIWIDGNVATPKSWSSVESELAGLFEAAREGDRSRVLELLAKCVCETAEPEEEVLAEPSRFRRASILAARERASDLKDEEAVTSHLGS